MEEGLGEKERRATFISPFERERATSGNSTNRFKILNSKKSFEKQVDCECVSVSEINIINSHTQREGEFKRERERKGGEREREGGSERDRDGVRE
jgi:hypothetical protein